MRPKDPNIDTALKYLCDNVYKPMSFDEIAHRCGCAKTTIFDIYDSAIRKLKKEDLEDIRKLWEELS